MQSPLEELLIYLLGVCGKTIENLGLLNCPSQENINAAKEGVVDLGVIELSSDV